MNSQWALSREKRLWWLIAAVLADRLVTLPNYHLESNPLVTALGPIAWTGLTIACLGVAILLWYDGELWEYSIAVAVVTATTILYAAGVSLNVYVLYVV